MLLEKDPANRFPSADALCVALETGNVPDLPALTSRDGRLGGVTISPREARPLADDGDYDAPTAEETARWDHPTVVEFRKKLAPFFAVSAVVTILAIFGVLNLMGIVGIWAVYLAYQYAKLWTDNFDWRDVFKQPKDRLFFDVVAETIDDFRALFDKKKRAEVLERDRLRARKTNRRLFGASTASRTASPIPTSELPAASVARVSPSYAAKLREASRNRDNILQLIQTLPKRERDQVAEVPATADALYRRIELLAVDLTELDRGFAENDTQNVEAEIEQLEAAANPFDPQSEERLRRLTILKRKRQALGDLRKRRESQGARFENCVLALENMRYDVLKLKTGGQSFQQVTQLAERAMSLAQEVDNAVYVAEEMRKSSTGGTRESPRRARGGRARRVECLTSFARASRPPSARATRLATRSDAEGWASSTGRATCACDAPWRSSCCHRSSRSATRFGRDSFARHKRLPSSAIRTSSPFTASTKSMGSSSS